MTSVVIPDRITQGHRFENEPVDLDGYYFVECTFYRCKLIFRGEDPVRLENCTIIECDWVFDGPAENTVRFLSALYHGLGASGEVLVKAIFEGIKDGSVDRSLLMSRNYTTSR
jgi:hypothetical protein